MPPALTLVWVASSRPRALAALALLLSFVPPPPFAAGLMGSVSFFSLVWALEMVVVRGRVAFFFFLFAPGFGYNR